MVLGLGLHSQNSYHGPRFDTFYLCIRAAIAGCGIALIPRYLVAEELSEGKLVVASGPPGGEQWPALHRPCRACGRSAQGQGLRAVDSGAGGRGGLI